ncbi:hypothetical protein VOLCADRAFT_91368 [Volvox carteri f. nagariensis]|uniref:Uncharacterized protein n=1 Tax=Volvox carteri f. nagariensis TaxID=3068 RepID=D8TWW1_VOLCA|nr:uncharacterized protein VOLCADRAFT_91368 [Volvox carteri f. nagariensis]EFJ48220.1 hypothetical protein VOLCADRAFT_91368 [Volvox carteri f. nagariensis]|eukprot:XP_002950905.1 hypothetical protein VOLCADRAFT_91368 [Volvox carteri f. nagariensis]
MNKHSAFEFAARVLIHWIVRPSPALNLLAQPIRRAGAYPEPQLYRMTAVPGQAHGQAHSRRQVGRSGEAARPKRGKPRDKIKKCNVLLDSSTWQPLRAFVWAFGATLQLPKADI